MLGNDAIPGKIIALAHQSSLVLCHNKETFHSSNFRHEEEADVAEIVEVLT